MTEDNNNDDIVEKKPAKKKKTLTQEVLSFAWIVFIVFAFRSTFFEPYKIPTGSMIPTLLIGDFILVNKLSYGVKVPYSHEFMAEPIYLFGPWQPKRGDVAVFYYPGDNSTNYIKRVVGVPGDTVEVINKVVYVNNVPLELTPKDGEILMADMDDKYQYNSFKFYTTKTGHAEHISQTDEDSYGLDFPKTVVPEGKYFVMGDNRDHSSDSRVWGFVPRKNIKGKAMMVWFSMTLPFERLLSFVRTNAGPLPGFTCKNSTTL